jgi:hypothetical protein
MRGRQRGDSPTFIDRLNKWLIAAQAVAVIGGVGIAVQSLWTTQATQSATLILELRRTLASGDYKKITKAIQDHGLTYPLLASFSDTDVESYIVNLEDTGLLVKESPVLAGMAYNHFSYDFEKAWCSQDVQKIITAARKADKSVTASSDPEYGAFEALATGYLKKEHQKCADLDKQ